MSIIPMEADAGAVLEMTLQIFRQRMYDGKPPTQDDLQALEKGMKAYAALKCNEHIAEQEGKPSISEAEQ